jgi:predicted RND superfamily exporter protein
MLLLAIVCSLLFVLDVILARWLAFVLTGGVALVFVVVWYLLPSVVDRRNRGA